MSYASNEGEIERERMGGKVYTGSKLSMKLLCIDGLMLNANFINFELHFL